MRSKLPQCIAYATSGVIEAKKGPAYRESQPGVPDTWHSDVTLVSEPHLGPVLPIGQRPVGYVPFDAKACTGSSMFLRETSPRSRRVVLKLSDHGVADGVRDHDAARRRLRL
jgi:hypothetical protein